MTVDSCCQYGPGYATPQDAFLNGSREKLLYIPVIVPDHSRPDYLVTVDSDPESKDYSKVIHRLPFPYKGDELHHSGWNACSSCYGDSSARSKLLILPGLKSGRVYGVDTQSDPRAPKLNKVVEPQDIQEATGLAYLHTSHCLGSGEIMISAMGDKEGNPRGGFLLLDQDLKVKSTWSQHETKYGYDFWYQPRHNVMVSSEWGAPSSFTKGFNPAEVEAKYGSSLYFWDWKERKVVQEVSLGQTGLIPLEVRFLHDPAQPHGYVGAALSSNVIHFSKDEATGLWQTQVAIPQSWVKVEGWALPELPPLITDILISLDDKYLYFSNWLRGDIAQYDVSDPQNPRLAGRVFVGGSIRKGGTVKVLGGLPEDVDEQPQIPLVQGHELHGGPQMLQLSLDGKRLYVTNSLFGPWDQQFYPDMVSKGSYLLQIDVDTERGGLSINHNFFVDFGAEPDGPGLAHEVRYPGGDCSSDIWL
ncbi:hypothetical protein CEUSTIGMA_g7631.t1 [Chlamydomonas eustigma]|uniref:Methanethiol oxidase n=1 Tax=Chlamydomonas eustigma TaxID=1157962 RepID=A0A250XAP6_9CHLO|nr:hypothetical protein CEUSTIGMA_g7631.t1 [Chlamydomonas eustigma]|eukprot:GAX80193.1 hypothetical protein CEUSTIGMA_g7631.t1 [Chlamydomonas eustigma]